MAEYSDLMAPRGVEGSTGTAGALAGPVVGVETLPLGRVCADAIDPVNIDPVKAAASTIATSRATSLLHIDIASPVAKPGKL
jgi:hypothetical protein